METNIALDRKKITYRLLESSLGLTSVLFLGTIVVLSFFQPSIIALFLIVYSFLWVLKLSLNTYYTVYTYRQLSRWRQFDWGKFFKNTGEDRISLLTQLQTQFADKIDWESKIESDIELLKNSSVDINEVHHITIFSVYNEPADVLLRSLRRIYDSEFSPQRITVFISQEERYGNTNNSKVEEAIRKELWINAYSVKEDDLSIVYSDSHATLNYSNPEFKSINHTDEKLTVVFTQHPGNLENEIKGKASNEDWAGRQASLYTKSNGINSETTLVTSLDADSHVGKYFFHHLTYRFCLSPDRLQAGFQPVHNYSNNFFRTSIWPRQIAAQTTLYNMGQQAINGETPLFAIYSLSLNALQKVNFWERQVIAEDAVLQVRCVNYFKGKFHVYPFYGVFEGDAVEGDDYLEVIKTQYQQLQRWAWGGVESFPYMMRRFYLDESGKEIDIRIRVRMTFLLFTNHFFWATSSILFTLGVYLPGTIGNFEFRSTQAAQNLALFSQYFTVLSVIFLLIFSFITAQYIGGSAEKNQDTKWYHWAQLGASCLLSPLFFIFMGIPALDAQIRGITGNYLNYIVTPKK
jgi:hypothetical protein